MTFREWKIICDNCNNKDKVWAWSDKLPLPCPTCGESTSLYSEPRGKAPSLITDDIPGGEVVDHLYPTPRVFYSKTDIKRACNELGWTRKGDTPVPYKVPWSGKKIEPERPAPLINAKPEPPAE